MLLWLYSVVRRDYSGIDRLWQLCPPVYCLMVAVAVDFEFTRVNLMTTLVILWGARLVYNHYRRGGFGKSGEDYRWKAVQEQYGPVGFQLLNVTSLPSRPRASGSTGPDLASSCSGRCSPAPYDSRSPSRPSAMRPTVAIGRPRPA